MAPFQELSEPSQAVLAQGVWLELAPDSSSLTFSARTQSRNQPNGLQARLQVRDSPQPYQDAKTPPYKYNNVRDTQRRSSYQLNIHSKSAV